MKKSRTAQPPLPVATSPRQTQEKRYNLGSWRNPRYGLRMALLTRNPICQRLLGAERIQCRNQATIVHHLVSPLDQPAAFWRPDNLCCLCVRCHPGGKKGTDWRVNIDFTPTNFTFSFSNMEDSHV